MININELLEQISESMVFLETGDVQAVAAMHSRFESLSRGFNEAGNSQFQKASEGIEEILKDILMEDVPDVPAAVSYINSCISVFQSVYRDGRKPGEISLPDLPGSGDNEGVFKLPDNVDEGIFTEFISRQNSELLDLEEKIMALDSGVGKEKILEIKRHMHTLKGESALMGLSEAEEICHKAEDIIENEGYTKHLPDILLQVKDWLLTYFSFYTGDIREKPPKNEILDVFKDYNPQPMKDVREVKPRVEAAVNQSDDDSQDLDHDAIVAELTDKFTKSSNPLKGDLELLSDFILETGEHLESADNHLMILENEPRNEESLNAVFRAFHTIKGVAGFLDLTMIGTLAHESENLLDRARKGEIRFQGSVCDISFKSLDKLRQLVHALQAGMNSGEYEFCDKEVPEVIFNLKQILNGEAVEVDTGSRERSEDVVVTEGAAEEEKEKGGEKRTGIKIKEFVKVDSERLDKLVNTIGEMVIVETMLNQLIKDTVDDHTGQLNARLNQINKITRELQEMGTSLRMVPVKPVFQKMARLIRDLSKKMRKPVNFIMTGEDTELDKTVVDMIGDPLVHLVRNSMDHGIEGTAEERKKAGKPEVGRIELRSFNAGGNIYIEIVDDGRGLDKEAIVNKAVRQGLIKENEKLSDRDIYNLIFEAGFSTAKKVTDVSGRGVGMDVVRKNIASLRGRVEISSVWGKGSTFSIILPLTLAIIEGMIIQVGTEKFIIPTLNIITSLRPDEKMLNTVMKKGEMLDLAGELVPMFRLERLFEVSEAIKDPCEGLIVVVEHEGKKTGILTDRLLGQSQIVIKSLGASMQGIDGISGGAILPDGKVGLILDIGGIIKIAHKTSGHTEETINL